MTSWDSALTWYSLTASSSSTCVERVHGSPVLHGKENSDRKKSLNEPLRSRVRKKIFWAAFIHTYKNIIL